MAGSNKCSNESRSRLRLEIEHIFEPARGQSGLTLHWLSSRIDVVSKSLTEEIGHLMASISRNALEQINAAGFTRAQYVREFSDDIWHGDRCGCPDDRCIGHHHQNPEDCSCLRAVLDDLIWNAREASALRSSSYLRDLAAMRDLTLLTYHAAVNEDRAINGPSWARGWTESQLLADLRADMMLARIGFDVELRDSFGMVR